MPDSTARGGFIDHAAAMFPYGVRRSDIHVHAVWPPAHRRDPKTLNALLRRFLEGTGLNESQWVALRLSGHLDGSVDADGLVSPNGGQGINMALRDAIVAANHLCPVLTRGAAAADIDVAARQAVAERMPEIVAIQEHQRKQTQSFLRSDRFLSRVAMRNLPFLVRTGLARVLVGKRLRTLQH